MAIIPDLPERNVPTLQRPIIENDDRHWLRETLMREMEELRELSRLISANWTSPKTAMEILDEVRD